MRTQSQGEGNDYQNACFMHIQRNTNRVLPLCEWYAQQQEHRICDIHDVKTTIRNTDNGLYQFLSHQLRQ